MATIVAKDLTREVPRSPFEELEGYPWLARLIDKVRALHAGKIGEYTPFPCGGDRRFLSTLGLDPDALKGVITGGASDHEIAAWVKAHQAPDALQKLGEYRAAMTVPIPPEAGDYYKIFQESLGTVRAARPQLDLSRVDNFNKLICAEEGHQAPSS